jgi:hypothetical protein
VKGDITMSLTIILILLSFVLGVCTGLYLRSRTGKDGSLQIDMSDPEKDIYRLQLDDDISNLSKKKKVILVVDLNAKLSG